MSLLLNGQQCVSVRLVIPWTGVWLAECVVDVTEVALVPTSAVPVVLTIGDAVLTGTVDPSGGSTFKDTAVVRVVGGRGGWTKTVSRQHFFNPAGLLLSSLVYGATGALVGEAVVDASPEILGKNFVRVAGQASGVFQSKQWFVEPVTGSTIVSDWPALPFDPEGTVLDWDNAQLSANCATDKLLLPGTRLIDDRFNGVTYIVRDVEQTFSKDGAVARVWCGTGGSPLKNALSGLVNNLVNTTYLKVYKYRVILPITGIGFALQGITPGAPDLNPVIQYPGLLPTSIVPSAEVLIGFVGGDPSQPYLSAPWTVGLTGALADFATALTPATLIPNGIQLLAALAALQKLQ